RDAEQTIPLNLLRQPPAKAYQLAPGDVLGVYVETILGDRNQPLPLHISPPIQTRDQRRLPPASGYPVTVQEDGTVGLPSIPPVTVAGLTLVQARETIRDLYLSKKL